MKFSFIISALHCQEWGDDGKLGVGKVMESWEELGEGSERKLGGGNDGKLGGETDRKLGDGSDGS